MMEQVISIIGFSVLLVAAIFIFVLRNVSPVIPFFYSNAIIQSRSRFLIKEEGWREFSESKSVGELIDHLEAHDYSFEEKIKSGLRGFHFAVEKNLAESILELKEIFPKKLCRVLDAYLVLWEAKMIKAVYRAKFSGAVAKEEAVFPVGSITPGFLNQMRQAPDIKKLKELFIKTSYSNIMKKEYRSLEEFELAIDAFVFESMLKETRGIKMHDSKAVFNLISIRLDIMNIMALIKAVSRKVSLEKKKSLFIKNNSELSKYHSELAKADSIQEIVRTCEDSAFGDALRKALADYEKDKSLSHFENELRRFYKNIILEQELGHSLGPYPLFAYLAKKEDEFHNLLSISKGIQAKMSQAEIMEMVI